MKSEKEDIFINFDKGIEDLRDYIENMITENVNLRQENKELHNKIKVLLLLLAKERRREI